MIEPCPVCGAVNEVDAMGKCTPRDPRCALKQPVNEPFVKEDD